MMLFVIAMVDPAARARLTRLRELAAPFGILPRDVHGHITLAAYAGGEEGRFISSCKAILSGYEKFSVRYDGVELFASTSAVVAGPAKGGAAGRHPARDRRSLGGGYERMDAAGCVAAPYDDFVSSSS